MNPSKIQKIIYVTVRSFAQWLVVEGFVLGLSMLISYVTSLFLLGTAFWETVRNSWIIINIVTINLGMFFAFVVTAIDTMNSSPVPSGQEEEEVRMEDDPIHQ